MEINYYLELGVDYMPKKIKLFSFALLISIILCGCKEKSGVTYDDYFEIKLSSNSSAQQYWEYELSKDGIVDIDESYDYGSCSKDSDGCAGGFSVYTIKPVQAGTVTINFRYLSGDDHKTMKTAIYTITVTDDHKVIETHRGTYFEED